MILAGAMLCATAFSYDANSDFKKFMTSMIPKVEKAFKTGDLKFFEDISTADFTEKEMGKTYTKAESMAQMKQGLAMGKPSEVKFKLMSSKVMGNTATAVTSGHMVMMMKAQKPKDKAHRMVMDMWEKQTWVKDGKAWKIKMIEEAKPSKMTMDGKPMDPSKMGG